MEALKGVEVQIVVSSNWGHNSHLGLTEVEFFSTQNRKIWLSGARVSVAGHIDTFQIDHILNGKTTTTHDKHMWCSLYKSRRKVRFHFLVPIGTKHDLSCVKIWNYNKPFCLDAGVRGVKVFVDDVSVWEGEVPKGTGTKSSDYACTVLVCIPESSPSNGSASDCDTTLSLEKPNLIGQSDQLVKRRIPYNPFKSPKLETTSEPTTPLPKTISTHYKPHTSPQLSSNRTKLPINQLSDQLANQISYKTTNQLSYQSTNQLLNRSPGHLANQLSRSKVTAVPKLKKSVSQSNLLECLFSPEANQMLEKSYSESELSKFLSADSPTLNPPKHGRRSQMRLGTAVTGKARPELPDAQLTDLTHLYTSKNRNIPSPNFSHSKPYPSNTPSLQSSRTEPVISGAKLKHTMDEMLQSLTTFQLSHKGRIVDLEGDSLDQFLEERSRIVTPRLNPILESEFVIPELPHGKFLSLMISSTWGDKHYLGLNGVEAFSSNGTKIEVCDIAADPPDINILPG